MNKFTFSVLLLAATLPAFVAAQDVPATVAPTPPADRSPDRDRSLVDNLARYDDHGRLSKAIDASGLLKPENRGKLAELLRYHVVVGLFDTATLTAKIDAGGGTARLTTMQGGTLLVKRSGSEFTVTDASNHTARITAADRYQRNGVVQVVDQVLMPNTQ